VTFVEVAQRCGLAPPTLVQRFSTRQGMLDLAPVQAAATLTAPTVELRAYSLELRKQISFALAAAIEGGELPRCDVAQLARNIQINFAGAVATALLERRDAALEISTAFDLQLANYI
jgi:hypothetical protein